MTQEGIKMIAKALALLTFGAGACGSVLVVPYAFTTDWRLLGIAGMYLIAGSVMITGGLSAYAHLIKDEK